MKGRVGVIAHPDIWALKYTRRPEQVEEYIGVPFPKEATETLGASFNLTKGPMWLSENIVTSGEIPMTTEYEKIGPILYIKENGKLKPDSVRDDQALFIKSEKGLIIILGCAHRGVINTIRHAQKLTGVEPVYAVIGGTHLISASIQKNRFNDCLIIESWYPEVGSVSLHWFASICHPGSEIRRSFLFQ